VLPVPLEQAVDPAVSRAKFDREIASFRSLGAAYRNRGIWLLEAEFPTVLVGFLATKLTPAPVVFAARLDFANYDLVPPSVQIVHPLTGVPFRAHEAPQLVRRVPIQLPGALAAANTTIAVPFQIARLLQFHNPVDVPFLCLPGVREYHNHPAHTGDSWLLHRARGEGKLAHIVEQLAKYGAEVVQTFVVQVQTPAVTMSISSESIPP
jgi:hypothetical protein